MIGERDGVAEQAAAQVDAGVGEREQRHDHVAGPRVQVVLQALVGRDRRQQALLRRARKLRRRLLAERAGQRGRALQIARATAGRRSSPARSRARRSTGSMPGLEHRDPQRRRPTTTAAGRAPIGERSAARAARANSASATAERHHRDVASCRRSRSPPAPPGRRRRRASAGTRAAGSPTAASSSAERAEREGRVGRHRRAPPVRARRRRR